MFVHCLYFAAGFTILLFLYLYHSTNQILVLVLPVPVSGVLVSNSFSPATDMAAMRHQILKLGQATGYSDVLKHWVRHSSSEGPLKTCLHDFHVASGGKMVDFAGYSMPVQYSSLSISASHHHTRTHCSIFDVSHMLQTRVHGKDRFEFIESLSVADAKNLKPNHGALTLFTNDQGGIIDDLIVTNAEEHLYVVSNAGCRDKDIPLMSARLKKMKEEEGRDVSLEFVEDRGLIALQGPSMMSCLQPLTGLDLARLGFMSSMVGTVAGIVGCRVTRCGYTGEDGVEISVPEKDCANLVETLLSSSGNPALAGLGARDSLRLEAGLCLYGNDIDSTTTPVEATLGWTIPKTRRVTGGFPGADIILSQLREGASRKRVGFLSKGPPARGHTHILDAEGNKVGEVTSGCPSPSLGSGTNVSMGYVDTSVSKVGTNLYFQVRNKRVEATVAKMPFVQLSLIII